MGDQRARVRFDTVLQAGGLEGLLTGLFAPRMLRPIYADELARLEHLAKVHPPIASGSSQETSSARANVAGA
jgi:hypothetical protein